MTLAFSVLPVILHHPGMELGIDAPSDAAVQLLDDVREWTGCDIRSTIENIDQDASITTSTQIIQAALALITFDALDARGITPDVLTGISLGGLVAATMAGALPRRDLFAYLAAISDVEEMRLRYPPSAERQAYSLEDFPDSVVVCTIPSDEDAANWLAAVGIDDLHVVARSGYTDLSGALQRVSIGGPGPRIDRLVASRYGESVPAAVDVRFLPHSLDHSPSGVPWPGVGAKRAAGVDFSVGA